MSTIHDKLAARAAAAVERTGSQNDVDTGGNGEGTTFKLAPAGKQKARLVGYIEKGIHPNNMDASKPDRAEFGLRFALFGKDCQNDDGSPITVDTFDMPISKFERAGAVKLFQKMCPKKDADHFIGLLDRVFWLEIIHREGKPDAQGNKKVYANLKKDSIGVAVKDILDDDDNIVGQQPVACAEAPENVFQIFEWDVPSKEDFDKLKPWDKQKIRSAINFPGSAIQQLVGDGKDDKPTNDGAGAQEPPEDEAEPQSKPVKSTQSVKVDESDLPAL